MRVAQCRKSLAGRQWAVRESDAVVQQPSGFVRSGSAVRHAITFGIVAGVTVLMGYGWAQPPPAKPQGVALTEIPLPDDASEQPKPKDWNDAERVRLLRPLPPGCDARLIREWLRIGCSWTLASLDGRQADESDPIRGEAKLTHRPASLALISGRQAGLAMWLKPPSEDDPDSFIEIIMPLRRGDRRIIQYAEHGHPDPIKGGIGDQQLGFMVSQQWLPGMSAPWVVVR